MHQVNTKAPRSQLQQFSSKIVCPL
uniref:Uncharacterized protein n=1 Tax=Anguilla anguilla TaxID=7936 RepID=A0A0E9QD38_ANGAN